ncbi:protein-disulfide reductase DsbD family protein [Lelliottia sp. V106_10]|uniref:protein-disulfide reductase DsbD family protein n=1 Tax=Lelliottia wanjuensis TaxID=3050585 RepID=UPI00254DE993|nr:MULTISPECIES: protein-disulfide reductase DsbD domain-containing protein [unclassified Lelliottia]MDK9359243.1 protein-disulfide reductase DsbD family protein [Lelliottia sp. V106_16]MDK9374618.1 protein-disulfide reductase DsbD family protein [Lelliottia sp. V106_10]MDK9602520.1 protein-disulfide reductase DsbD family protein [Lelliottia sp. V106_5]
MHAFLRQLLICLLWLWLPVSQAADSGWLRAADNDHASVRLRADAQQKGDTRLLLDVSLEKGWKTYWRSPGEGGIAPAIKWQTPLEMDWRWPVPQRFEVAGISTQGYDGKVSFPITLRGAMPEKLAGVLTLSTCSNVCILTDYPFALDLSAPADPQFSYDFSRALGTLPLSEGLTSGLTAGFGAEKLTVTATREAGWQNPELFIDTLADTDFGKPVYRVDGQTLTATLPVSDGWGDAAPDLRGKTLSLVLADSGQAQESRVTVGETQSSAAPLSLGWILLMALAGGLILNVMPCVLPVLAMKLGSIVQASMTHRRVVRQQFMASAAGIVTSFLALALMMTALRLSNQALGWGIQFQNPWFIAAMVLVMVGFSASLLGLFEIRLSSGFSTFLATRGGNGLVGHFCQGAFATLLATPCTAPFLGTAVSVALVAPLSLLWGIFLVMGIGMSLPWLLIAAWPGLALRLPRPGRWMNVVRIILGLMMLVSGLWLASLLAVHIGPLPTQAFSALLVIALLLATLWRWGWRVALWSSMAAILALAMTLPLLRSGHTGLTKDRIAWQPLSEEAITAALADNKRVFVDVTADWCVTCKANKYNVLLRDEVQDALSAPDVVALRGDWSRPSETIGQFLRARQSAAVPFNQIYGPGLEQGRVLPPLLDRDDVLQTLTDAKGK